MNKEKIVLFFGLLIFAAVIGYAFFTNQSVEQPSQTIKDLSSASPAPSSAVNLDQATENTIEAAAEAIDTNDSSACDSISAADERAACVGRYQTNAAVQNDDLEACSDIADSYWRTNCHDQIIQAMAFDTKDPSKCSSISDLDRRSKCEELASQE